MNHGYFQQIFGLRRKISEPVDELVDHVGAPFCIADLRNAFVQGQSRHLVVHVGLRQIGLHRQLDARFGLQRAFGVRFAAELSDDLLHKAAVHLVADRHHVPGLLCPQNVSGAAEFEVAHRNAKTGAELCKFPDGAQTLFGDFRQDFIFFIDEICISQAVRTADPSPQLIQLGQSQPVRI